MLLLLVVFYIFERCTAIESGILSPNYRRESNFTVNNGMSSIVRVCTDVNHDVVQLLFVCTGIYVAPRWAILSSWCASHSLPNNEPRLYGGGNKLNCDNGANRKPITITKLKKGIYQLMLIKLNTAFKAKDKVHVIKMSDEPINPESCVVFCSWTQFNQTGEKLDVACNETMVTYNPKSASGKQYLQSAVVVPGLNIHAYTNVAGSPIICSGKLVGFTGKEIFPGSARVMLQFEPIRLFMNEIDKVIKSSNDADITGENMEDESSTNNTQYHKNRIKGKVASKIHAGKRKSPKNSDSKLEATDSNVKKKNVRIIKEKLIKRNQERPGTNRERVDVEEK